MKYFTALLFILCCSCDNGRTTAPIIPTSDIIVLKEGESAYVDPFNIRVGFQKVLGDSRCAIGVICVWEGRADVRLWFSKSRSDTVFFTAPIYGYVTQVDTGRHVPVDTLGYRFKILQLDPYPEIGTRWPPEFYTATIHVKKL